MAFDYIKKDFTLKFGSTSKTENVGLRNFLMEIYKYMTFALALTGIIAYLIASVEPINRIIFSTPLYFISMIAPFGIVIYLSLRLKYMSFNVARNWFWAYSALMGISMASIFLVYTNHSIAKVFLITASTFGAMSLYGYTTKRDLTGIGSFMFMGLIGIIIAGLVNLFLHSPMVDFSISVIGVMIFIGLTAYDVQKLKDMYLSVENRVNNDEIGKFAIYGALTLYLDFINLFINLLRLFGNRRN